MNGQSTALALAMLEAALASCVDTMMVETHPSLGEVETDRLRRHLSTVHAEIRTARATVRYGPDLT